MNKDKINKILGDKQKLAELFSEFSKSFEEKTITLEVPGKPECYVRERVVRGGHAYNPKKKKMLDYKATVLSLLKDEDKNYLNDLIRSTATYEVSLSFIFFMPTQAGSTILDSVKKEIGMIVPTSTPDCDNLIKFALDSLHDVFYDDDSKVTDVYGAKRYSMNPRTIVECKIRKYK